MDLIMQSISITFFITTVFSVGFYFSKFVTLEKSIDLKEKEQDKEIKKINIEQINLKNEFLTNFISTKKDIKHIMEGTIRMEEKMDNSFEKIDIKIDNVKKSLDNCQARNFNSMIEEKKIFKKHNDNRL